MNSADLINEQLIYLDFEAFSKEHALKEVAQLVYQAGRVQDKESYFHGLLEREENATTGFGDGIAIPHAKIDQVIKPTIAIIKLKNPIDWKAMDDKPVRLIIALAVPAQEGGKLHLKLLAKLSEQLMEEEFKEALLSAGTKSEIYNTITGIF